MDAAIRIVLLTLQGCKLHTHDHWLLPCTRHHSRGYNEDFHHDTSLTTGLFQDSMMSKHASILVDYVGPPSAEVCRTTVISSSGWPKVYRTQVSRGWRWPLSSNPAIKKHEVSCVPNTPNTMANCIGALVRWRDGKIWVIWVAKTK